MQADSNLFMLSIFGSCTPLAESDCFKDLIKQNLRIWKHVLTRIFAQTSNNFGAKKCTVRTIPQTVEILFTLRVAITMLNASLSEFFASFTMSGHDSKLQKAIFSNVGSNPQQQQQLSSCIDLTKRFARSKS